jgi:hypothetical protein
LTVLFGHPTGSPFSHNAALAHFEAHQLESFCVPWMPSAATLRLLEYLGPLRPMARRLGRRRFPPLATAPKIQGRVGEIRRLITRAVGRGDESLDYEANDWLMRTMCRECKRNFKKLSDAVKLVSTICRSATIAPGKKHKMSWSADL